MVEAERTWNLSRKSQKLYWNILREIIDKQELTHVESALLIEKNGGV